MDSGKLLKFKEAVLIYRGPLDSLWYSITAILSGEVVITPATPYRKAITSMLMLVGVTFIGFLTASLAS